MADRTFKRGGEIIITLGNDGGAAKLALASALNHRGKGVLLPPRKNDYLPRRKKSKESFIKIYDGGYIRFGEGFKSFAYLEAAPAGDRAGYELSKENNSLNDPPLPYGANAVTREHYIALAAEIGQIPIADFFSLSNHIETYRADYETDGYFSMHGSINGFDITGRFKTEDDPAFNEKWQDEGLKLENDELNYLSFNFSGGFESYGFYNNISDEPEYNTAVTKELDYNAERFILKPTKKMDIVLIPRIRLFQAAATSEIPETADASVIWSPAYKYSDRREFRYDKSFEHYRDDFTFTTDWIRGSAGRTDQPTYARNYKKILAYDALGVPCANVLDAPGFTPPPYPGVIGASVVAKGLVSGIGSIEGLFLGCGEVPVPENVPRAIIYQNGERYFVWS